MPTHSLLEPGNLSLVLVDGAGELPYLHVELADSGRITTALVLQLGKLYRKIERNWHEGHIKDFWG